MKTAQQAPEAAPSQEQARKTGAVEAALDEALAMTFPASDPVSLTRGARYRKSGA